ncbi:HNH endonuclease, partial [Cronobacter sakazakii]
DINKSFINTRLPLHEAIINQTGKNERQRKPFLRDAWNPAFATRLQQWAPEPQQELIF